MQKIAKPACVLAILPTIGKYFLLVITGLLPLLTYSQVQTQPLINANIQGRVIDSLTQEPLPGAHVQLDGVTHSVSTDEQGNFTFVTGQKLPATLLVSYIGYQQIKVIVTQVSVTIQLKPLLHQLNDVVVTGYSSQSKRLYTGSAAQVKATALENRPAQSFDQLLGGQAAGVNIIQPSGALNATPVFRIRGINSITSSIYPLIIVDGVTIFTESAGGNVGNNPLASVNPSDIETIDVLKDASATAIYGSCAANGVVVITTKKGKPGKARASYDSWVSFSKPYNLPELLNATDYVAIKNEARTNAGLSPGFVLGTDAQGHTIETNWYDVAYQTGVSHNHNVSISGATDATRYFLSTNFTDQNGIIKTNNFKQKGLRLNLDHQLNKLIKVGTNTYLQPV